jgi:hypothetical protein
MLHMRPVPDEPAYTSGVEPTGKAPGLGAPRAAAGRVRAMERGARAEDGAQWARHQGQRACRGTPEPHGEPMPGWLIQGR